MNLFRFREGWPYHVSAGAVVFDKELKRICILKRTADHYGEDSWHLPKGTLDNNEPLEAAARREVLEEAGLEIKIIGYLGAKTDEWIAQKEKLPINKTVHYFVATLINQTNNMDDEHDEIEWLSVKLAKDRLKINIKREDEIVDRAQAFIKDQL